MKYLAKTVNGFDTRNKFIRSMDLARAYDADTARINYESVWFSSTKKQYINTAFQQVLENSLFWPKHVITDMLDEIFIEEADNYDAKIMAQDIDILKSKYQIWATKRKNQPISTDDIVKAIKQFESKYKYSCPDTFKSAWMNAGAYITLSYGIKYENLLFPGMTQEQSLSKLKALALEIVTDMNHDVDDRLFKLCHFLYVQKYTNV